jgi:hypothetical protein
MNPDEELSITTDWPAVEVEPPPTLREQVEAHLWYAHEATDHPDTMLMHLAIAAGLGLASVTLDDLDAEAATNVGLDGLVQ